jgi:UDP-N-acetyl-D-galactosamine dehydrogenase
MRAVAVVGLGYVGLPLALAFSKVTKTIGFDVNSEKVEDLKAFRDTNNEVQRDDFLSAGEIHFTNNPEDLSEAHYIVVAVPTPVTAAKIPDMSILEAACVFVGENMSPGCIVIFESTVYPGATEELCVPLLEKASGLLNEKSGFLVGYSPERINPGDKKRRLQDIIKVVSGQDEDTCDEVFLLYSGIITAGLFRAKNIKTAEASKVIENAQRDLNIAFMNELSVVFDRLGLDTLDVLEAAGTKWNFTPYRPGLVGGHCISVDPYYLAHKSKLAGHNAELILTARSVNESMPRIIVDKAADLVGFDGTGVGLNVGVLGVTFKEDCNDFRNSKVFDLIMELKNLSCIIVSVGHSDYKRLSPSDLFGMCSRKVLLDLKGIYDRPELKSLGFTVWRM